MKVARVQIECSRVGFPSMKESIDKLNVNSLRQGCPDLRYLAALVAWANNTLGYTSYSVKLLARGTRECFQKQRSFHSQTQTNLFNN